MAYLYGDVDEVSPYLKARKKFYTTEAWDKIFSALTSSVTLYIGNLSFYTDEEQVYSLFLTCGPVRRVIMGINKFTHLPCGFCFVEYYFHKDAMAARDYLNGTKLDDRIIRVDLDPGFEPGRQYGRGMTGGQVRDDRRKEYDEGRGGLPPKQRRRIEQQALESGTLTTPVSSSDPNVPSSLVDTETNPTSQHNHKNNDTNNNYNNDHNTNYFRYEQSSANSNTNPNSNTMGNHDDNNNSESNNNMKRSYHKYNNNNYNPNNNYDTHLNNRRRR